MTVLRELVCKREVRCILTNPASRCVVRMGGCVVRMVNGQWHNAPAIATKPGSKISPNADILPLCEIASKAHLEN